MNRTSSSQSLRRSRSRASDSTDGKFDNLPQPYRMICKVIEEDILDAAWFEIIRKHPDIQLKADGTSVDLNKNHNLNNKIKCEKYKSYGKYVTSLTACGGDLVCSIDEAGSFQLCSQQTMETMAAVDLTTVAASDLADNSDLDNEQMSYYKIANIISPTRSSSSSSSSGGGSSSSWVGRALVYCLKAATKEAVPDPAAKKPAKGAAAPVEAVRQKELKLNVILLDISMSRPPVAQQGIAATPTAAAAAAGVVNRAVYSAAVVHNFTLDSYAFSEDELNANVITGVCESICFDLSPCGRALSILTHGPQGSCTVYELDSYTPMPQPEPVSDVVPEENVTDETSGGGGASDAALDASQSPESPAPPPVPKIVTRVESSHPSLQGHHMKGVAMFARIAAETPAVLSKTTKVSMTPPIAAAAAASSSSSSAAPGTKPKTAALTPKAAAATAAAAAAAAEIKSNRREQHEDLVKEGPLSMNYWESRGLVITMADAPNIHLYGLCAVPGFDENSAAAKNAAPAADVAAAAAAKGKKGETAADEVKPSAAATPYTPYSLERLNLTSTVSAYAIDVHRKYLAVGQTDGTTALWNLEEVNFIKTVGVQKSAITCLSLQYKPESRTYYLISGCLDGTMCFFSTAAATISSSTTATNMEPSHSKGATFLAQPALPAPLSTMELREFRNDMRFTSVIQFKLPFREEKTKNSNFSTTATLNQSMIQEVAMSLLIAEYSDGSIVSYDFEKFTLLGQLGTTDRINFKNVTTELFSDRYLPDLAVLKSEAEEKAALAAQEAEAALLAAEQSASAAAGGGGEDGDDTASAQAHIEPTQQQQQQQQAQDEVVAEEEEVAVTLRNDMFSDGGTWGYNSYPELVRLVTEDQAPISRFAGHWTVSESYIYCMSIRTGRLYMSFYPVNSILGLGLHSMNTLDVFNHSTVTMKSSKSKQLLNGSRPTSGGRKLMTKTASNTSMGSAAAVGGLRPTSPSAHRNNQINSSSSRTLPALLNTNSGIMSTAAGSRTALGVNGTAGGGGATVLKPKLSVGAPTTVTAQEILQFKMQRTMGGKRPPATKQFKDLADFV